MNYQGHIVDAVNREIFDGILSVENGRIVEVKRCELPRRETPWPYYLPGFIDSHVHDIGCTMQSPFITMAFMALPVIPNLKITDRHLMDTKNMQIIEK